VYHVLNRSVGKMHLFGKDADFEAFQRVMVEAHQRHPIRILSYSVLSNHWHFAVWPDADGQVTAFCRWLAHTHAMRWGLETGTQLVIDSSCVPVSALAASPFLLLVSAAFACMANCLSSTISARTSSAFPASEIASRMARSDSDIVTRRKRSDWAPTRPTTKELFPAAETVSTRIGSLKRGPIRVCPTRKGAVSLIFAPGGVQIL